MASHYLYDSIWLDAHLATLCPSSPYGAILDGAIAVKDARIAWIGPQADLPQTPKELAPHVYSLSGAWITPGLIDCHTHLVYAGNRAHEFALRLQGKTYAEIAKAGGGIQATVNATRAATQEQLFQASALRLQALLAEGVTVIEIKSGYGLDLDTELKMLRVARQLQQHYPVTIRTTFLGAHTVPNEYLDNADAYLDFICELVLPTAYLEGLVDAVDAFCEKIAFTPEQTKRVFMAAQRHGIPVKLHAEQLSDLSGAALAAEFQALSADHLEYVSETSIKAMAKAGTVAVLLPGAYYYLRETQSPPIHLFRQYKIPIAIATDCNPGTSPNCSLLLMLNMACTLFQLTPAEALAGITRHAAMALGLQQQYGTLELGKQADFVIWDIKDPVELAYHFGFNPCITKVKAGILQTAANPAVKNKIKLI